MGIRSYHLGEFEEVVLLTVGILHGEAYGVSIKKEIESRLSRTVSMGALHTALVRLEKKGYIRAHEGESSPERVGRPKRYVEMTAIGKKALEHSKETRDNLWNALPKNVFGTGKA